MNDSMIKELEELKTDKYVKLSKKYDRAKYKQEQLLYTLRWHKKRGEKIAALGYREEDIEEAVLNGDLEL